MLREQLCLFYILSTVLIQTTIQTTDMRLRELSYLLGRQCSFLQFECNCYWTCLIASTHNTVLAGSGWVGGIRTHLYKPFVFYNLSPLGHHRENKILLGNNHNDRAAAKSKPKPSTSIFPPSYLNCHLQTISFHFQSKHFWEEKTGSEGPWLLNFPPPNPHFHPQILIMWRTKIESQPKSKTFPD